VLGGLIKNLVGLFHCRFPNTHCFTARVVQDHRSFRSRLFHLLNHAEAKFCVGVPSCAERFDEFRYLRAQRGNRSVNFPGLIPAK
jgi:hypothetical protein